MRKNLIRLPRDLIFRLKDIMPANKYNSVIHAFSLKRPTTVRVNTLKITPRDFREEMARYGFNMEPVSWWGKAFILKNKPLGELRKLKHYEDGFFYVQSLASMIPALVLDPKSGEKVLDICAAPGGKTTQMAAMMEGKGEIVANESNPVRCELLEANLRRQGAVSVKISQIRGEYFGRTNPAYFDRVLVDVPCSGEGRIHCYHRETYAGWSEKKIRNYSRLQKEILLSAAKAVKKGGKIVYATCTLAPEENEEVIDWLLKEGKGRIVLERISLIGISMMTGLTAFRENTYSKELINSIRILPSNLMEGFFIAALRKKL